ncbi:MAG: hypothetical protein R3B70_21220 [Polyangiaceae bacterium]
MILFATTLTLVTGASAVGPSAALADEDAPIRSGSTLVARGDCELEKVTISRGSRVQVTAIGGDKASIVLPDGYVLRNIGIRRIRYFFDVVR